MVTIAAGSDVLDDLRNRLSAPPDVSADVTLVPVDSDSTDWSVVDGAIRWGMNADAAAAMLAKAANVRWLHSPGAGVER